MTEKPDNADDEQIIPGIGPSEASMSDAGEDDYEDDDELSDDDSSDDMDGMSEDLTPNDIFGLDPLDVLTLEELADYLKVSVGAVRRAVKEQQLPGRNIGGDWRFLRDGVANWLRGQQAPAQQQQQARTEYSSYKSPQPEGDQYSRGTEQSHQSDDSGGEYRPRKRYSEGGYQGGGYQGGGQQGGGYQGGGQQGGGQYGNRGGQYSSEGQSGGGTSYGERRPPRRPFRANEGGGYGSYGGGGAGAAGGGGAGGGGYRAGGNQYGGSGGYSAGGQQFGGGYKKKNKRQVFDNERGKRLDRRKENEGSDDQQS